MGSGFDTDELWQEALANYLDETGVDLRRHDLARLCECKTVKDVLVVIEDEMDTFRAFDIDNGNWYDMRDLVKRITGSALGLCDAVAVEGVPNVSDLTDGLMRLK